MTIQEEVFDEFRKRLLAADGFTEDMVDQLCDIFKTGKKPKADDLAKILAKRSGKTSL